MGTKGTEIVGMDVKQLIELLNKALADEWLAYYQYWVGAKVIKGPMRSDVQKELEEHAGEELEHANLLAERIIQLGGVPLLDPNEWSKKSSCGYEAPADPNVRMVLEQNIKGEQCAIVVYHKILEKVKLGNDPVTFHLVRKILQDEVKHEQDLEDLLDDLELLKE